MERNNREMIGATMIFPLQGMTLEEILARDPLQWRQWRLFLLVLREHLVTGFNYQMTLDIQKNKIIGMKDMNFIAGETQTAYYTDSYS